MEIIGVGMGRTGTTSIQRALGVLDYRAYNFEAVVRHRHFDAWRELFTGETDPDWPRIFDGYDASVAWPVCFFYEPLLEAYPDAKFLLTTRDPERWADSVIRVSQPLARLRSFRFVPRVRSMLELMDAMMVPILGDVPPDRDRAIAAFVQHERDVRARIPADRLLVYEVKEGWEPLCDFLGHPVPDAPFPYENRGDGFIKEMLERFVRGQPV